MLSDSPYRTREPVLTPGWGVGAGLAGSLLMLLVISLMRPFSGLSVGDLLTRVGEAVHLGRLTVLSDSRLSAGGLYVLVGSLLGLLYAVSQEQIPVRGLVAVGVFYGIVIWVASRVLTFLFFGSALRPAVHSSAWFLACVVYGLCLAGCAVWVSLHRPRSTEAIPID